MAAIHVAVSSNLAVDCAPFYQDGPDQGEVG